MPEGGARLERQGNRVSEAPGEVLMRLVADVKSALRCRQVNGRRFAHDEQSGNAQGSPFLLFYLMVSETGGMATDPV
jgi:hypothetical protein